MKKKFNYNGATYIFEDYDDDTNSPYGVDYGMYVSKLGENAIGLFPGERVENYCINDNLDSTKCIELITINFKDCA